MKSDYEKGLEFAVRSLSRKAQLTFELRQKLLKRNIPEKETEKILCYLTDLGYLNDKEIIVRFIQRERGKCNGDRVIFQKLLLKGVPKDLIEENLQNREKEEEIEQIRAFIAKKHPDFTTENMELKHKLTQKLLRKGFDYESIKSSLS